MALGACATLEAPAGRMARHSRGFELVERMRFPPLTLTIPEVGREVERRVLPNGMVLFVMEDRTLPTLDISAVIRAGTIYEAPAEVALAQFAGGLLRTGGTASLKPDALNEELEFMAASIETGIGTESGSASLSALAKDADRALELFAEILMRPAFDPEQVEAARGRWIEDLRRIKDTPTRLLGREFARAMYTEEHPLGRQVTEDRARAIRREDLFAFHRRYFRPNNVMMAVVGDFAKEEMIAKVAQAFAAWEPGTVDLPPTPKAKADRPPGIYLVDRPIPQASVALGHFGIDRWNPDRYAIEVMDYILGASGFTSRITERVRSDEGLAYSVSTNFPTNTRDLGVFRATVQTRNDRVHRAIAAIREEIRKMQAAPVSPAELRAAQEAYINSFVFRFTSPLGNVVRLMMLEYDGYPPDHYKTLLDRYRAVTREDIHRVANQYLRPEAMTIVVVGDASRFEQPLDALGPVTRLSP